MRRFIVRMGLLVTCLACCSQPACAAELSLRADGQQVPRDVLEAEAEGLVEVKYIPNDSRSAQIVVANRTDQPLTLRLPDAFTGVPVLAQLGMGARVLGRDRRRGAFHQNCDRRATRPAKGEVGCY
jgi:hypothetical protein